MLNGEKPSETATKALDVALILHADHELNASTFAARVIAATLSDLHSAITGAIGALKGPLHGGANEAVMHLLYAIDKAGEDPVEHVRKMLANKEKISGFGHRVYTTEDPRATHLRKMSEDLGKDAKPKWYEMSRKIELFVKDEKKLNANVDFYSASTYTTLGIDIDLFTPIFAISRIAGWCAHVIEQHDDNRLIRPRADYTGPAYPAPYICPMAQRITSTLGLPTGDDANGLGAGQFTYAFINHFERQWGDNFTPNIELGIDDSPNLTSPRVLKSYEVVGTSAHFQAGLDASLPWWNIDFESDAYEELPLGTQTVTSTTTKGKKGKQVTTSPRRRVSAKTTVSITR
jgi:hypothetical protein